MISSKQSMFLTISKEGPISKREIQKINDCSWSLVSDTTNELLEEGFIELSEKVGQGKGRKADTYDVCKYHNVCIGIEINFEGVIVVCTDLKGRKLEEIQYHFEDYEKDEALKTVFEALDQMVSKYSDKKIYAIGCSIQGAVDMEKGISAHIHRIKGWNDVPVKDLIEERYHIKTIVYHDTDCLLKSNLILENIKEDNVVIIRLSNRLGVGMSIINKGMIYNGSHGKSGEIGAIPLGREDGKEYYLYNHIGRRAFTDDYFEISKERVEYDEFVRRIYNNETNAVRVYEKLAKYIAKAIITANSLYDPDLIVFNDSECDNHELMYYLVEREIRDMGWSEDFVLKETTLGADASTMGAALFAIEEAVTMI